MERSDEIAATAQAAKDVVPRDSDRESPEYKLWYSLLETSVFFRESDLGYMPLLGTFEGLGPDLENVVGPLKENPELVNPLYKHLKNNLYNTNERVITVWEIVGVPNVVLAKTQDEDKTQLGWFRFH